MTDKITKKELKEPDILQVTFWKLVDYLTKNRKRVIIISAIVAMHIIGGVAWFIYNDRYEKGAQEKYRQAYDFDLKGGVRGSDHAIKGYVDLTDIYPRSRAAMLAYYRLGGLYFQQGKHEESIAAYEKFLKSATIDPVLLSLANSGLGYAHEARKDYPKAVTAFERAAETTPGDRLAAINYRNLARIYEQLGDVPKSLDYYKKALQKAKDPSQELFLKRKIAELG